jgi:hypothetical protein
MPGRCRPRSRRSGATAAALRVLLHAARDVVATAVRVRGVSAEGCSTVDVAEVLAGSPMRMRASAAVVSCGSRETTNLTKQGVTT